LRGRVLDERGAASILYVASLPLFFMLAGIAIDSAAAYSEQAILQATANAAALRAGLDVRSKDNTVVVSDAQAYAAKNLPASANGTVLAASDVETGNWDFTNRVFTACTAYSSPIACSNPAGITINAVRVLVRRAAANNNPFPTAFLGYIGRPSWDLSALAIAAIGSSGGACFVSTSSITLKNNGTITAQGCNVAFEGSVSGKNAQTDQVTATNGGAVVFGPDASSSGVSFSPAPVTSAPVPSDPYANTPLPQIGSCNGITTLDGTNAHLPVANSTYCGTVNISGTVTLPAGTYVLNGATFALANNATLSGTGVTLVLTGSAANGWGNLTVQNSPTISLTAPTSGTYSGLALYGDPAGGVNVAITDGSGGGSNSVALNVNGAIYMPQGLLTVKNAAVTSVSCLQIVVGTVTATNGFTFSTPNTCTTTGTFAIGHARLVL
jgi:hypothetical protein